MPSGVSFESKYYILLNTRAAQKVGSNHEEVCNIAVQLSCFMQLML